MSSAAQIAANRANAQQSTGPKSPEGKAASSHNAVKSALTGRTVLLPSDDVEAYLNTITQLSIAYKPATHEESELLQSIADTDWRLRRIPNIEAGIYALGRRQFAEEFAGETELIDAKTFLTYRRDLSNLSLQESRLRRQRQKDLDQLKALQAQRQEQAANLPKPAQEPAPQPAPKSETAAQPKTATQPPAEAPANAPQPEIGFEFSTSPLPGKKAA